MCNVVNIICQHLPLFVMKLTAKKNVFLSHLIQKLFTLLWIFSLILPVTIVNGTRIIFSVNQLHFQKKNESNEIYHFVFSLYNV